MATRTLVSPVAIPAVETTEAPKVQEASQEAAVCAHHWVLEPNDHPTSLGVCRLCKEVKEFNNFIERDQWVHKESSAKIPMLHTAGFKENPLDV